jgi:uncharacterized protein (TIGR02996 family)
VTPEDAFIEDIRENPDDDVPRLIFADWLEDNGDPDRADFIRTLIRRAGTLSEDGSALATHAAKLLQANWQRWAGPLGGLLGDGFPNRNWALTGFGLESVRHFMPRGFVEEVEVTAGQFVEVAPRLLRLHPVRHLRLHQAADHAAALAGLPELRWVEKLNLVDPYRAPLDAGGMESLARSPHLGRLWSFTAPGNHLGDDGAAALAAAPWLGGVRSLSLADNGLSARGAAALAATPQAFRPDNLCLDRNPIGDEGAVALSRSPVLQRVEYLSLRRCGVAAAGAVALRASPHLPRGAKLDLVAW